MRLIGCPIKTEEDEDARTMAERFEAAADEEVYVWANDNMLGGM